jgi:hypothetical protein
VFEHKKFSSDNQAYCVWAKKFCFEDFLYLQTISLESSIHVADSMSSFIEVWGSHSNAAKDSSFLDCLVQED